MVLKNKNFIQASVQVVSDRARYHIFPSSLYIGAIIMAREQRNWTARCYGIYVCSLFRKTHISRPRMPWFQGPKAAERKVLMCTRLIFWFRFQKSSEVKWKLPKQNGSFSGKLKVPQPVISYDMTYWSLPLNLFQLLSTGFPLSSQRLSPSDFPRMTWLMTQDVSSIFHESTFFAGSPLFLRWSSNNGLIFLRDFENSVHAKNICL